jgi:hypothetical protein
MNLFYLDADMEKNAAYHVDRHMKMLLESCQLLCTTFHLQNIPAPYRKTHENHPSAVWTRQSKENFKWVINYAGSLAREHTFRYGTRHKSTDVLEWVQENKSKLVFRDRGFTTFALAMPDEFKTSCPIESYRNYYREGKKHLHSWKNREKPDWI